jgi:nitrite reductase/ring-hydroxylating ferredoxin subunit
MPASLPALRFDRRRRVPYKRAMTEAAWTDVLAGADLPEETLTRVTLGEDGVLLFRTGGEVFAIGARCTHAGMQLTNGPVSGVGSNAMVTCRAHGSRFRIADGRVLGPPAQAPLPTYDVHEVNGRLEVRPR